MLQPQQFTPEPGMGIYLVTHLVSNNPAVPRQTNKKQLPKYTSEINQATTAPEYSFCAPGFSDSQSHSTPVNSYLNESSLC